MSPPHSARKGLLLLGLAGACCGWLHAQTFAPQGSEFSISGALSGDQVAPALSISTSGGYLVWQDNGIDTNGWGIGAIKLSSSVSPDGSPFRVNVTQKGDQQKPSVALLEGGGAVVAWQSTGRGRGASNHVYARFIGPDGAFLTSDVQVEPSFSRAVRGYTTNLFAYRVNRGRNLRFRILESRKEDRDNAQNPVVAALPDGGAVVVYSASRRVQTNTSQLARTVTIKGIQSYTNDLLKKVVLRDDAGLEIFLQRFSAAGQKVGGEVLVNQFSAHDQRNPAVAPLPNGGFIVTWASERAMADILRNPGEVQISARLFGSAGESLSDEFDVASPGVIAATPSVSALADGRFTVAWAQVDVSNRMNSWDVYARSFAADGTPMAEPFRVNNHQRHPQTTPDVVSVGLNQMVAWTSWGQDSSFEGVFAQFLSSGSPSGAERRVNTETASRQIDPVVASDGVGRFVAAWSGFIGSSGFDIQAQRYHTTQPDGFVAPPVVTGGSSVEWVSAGALTLSPSAGGGLARSLQVSWGVQAGASYQLQMSTNLNSWTDVGAPRSSNESRDSVLLDTTLPAAFYRVIRVP